jgi:hypothetical protein
LVAIELGGVMLNRRHGDARRELPVPGGSMAHTLAAPGDEPVYGRLLRSPDRGESWKELAVTAPIVAMALVP